MSDFNDCTFTGRLGADPEVRKSQDGRSIVNLRLAVSDQWRDKTSGEKKERTTWVPIVIFNEGLGKVAEQYLRKGSRILVRGALSVRSWEDQSGAKRYATEIVLQGFNAVLTMLDGPQGPAGGRGDDRGYPSGGGKRTTAGGAGNGRDAPPPADDTDDEIPF